jgi:hypothetical protein
VRINPGKFTVTVRPLARGKEVIGGYAILPVETREEAIEHSQDFLNGVGPGEYEVLPIFDLSQVLPPSQRPPQLQRPGGAALRHRPEDVLIGSPCRLPIQPAPSMLSGGSNPPD